MSTQTEKTKEQIAAITDLKRTKRLLLALRGLAEDKAEKSIVTAINETTDRLHRSITDMGSKLKQLDIERNREATLPAQGGN